MKADVQVTVKCIVYNHEKYLRQALQSIVGQKTNFLFKVIVHDDASTDESVSIIREFKKNYPDLIQPIYETENQYSKGVSISRLLDPYLSGKYVAICEGDDYWTDDTKLQRQYDFMEEHSDYSLVANQCNIVNEQGKFISKYSTSTKTDYMQGEIINHTNAFQTASMFYRKDSLDKHQSFWYSVKPFDYALKSILSLEGKTHVFPETMSSYRKASDGSWTMRVEHCPQKYIEHIQQSIAFYLQLDEYTNNRFHDFIDQEIRRRNFSMLTMDRSKSANQKIIAEYRELYDKLPIKSRLLRKFLSVFGSKEKK